MNVVLIGYRGTGKSTVAQIVARNLGWEALSLDQMIVQKAGKAIPKIVDELGWEYFRDLESEVVVETAGRDKVVLDCGGGVILRAANVQALKDKGKVFLLTATPDTIVSRIKEDTNRPALIQGKTFLEEIAEVLESRNPLYRAAADVQIATDDKTPQEIAEVVISFVRESII